MGKDARAHVCQHTVCESSILYCSTLAVALHATVHVRLFKDRGRPGGLQIQCIDQSQVSRAGACMQTSLQFCMQTHIYSSLLHDPWAIQRAHISLTTLPAELFPGLVLHGARQQNNLQQVRVH